MPKRFAKHQRDRAALMVRERLDEYPSLYWAKAPKLGVGNKDHPKVDHFRQVVAVLCQANMDTSQNSSLQSAACLVSSKVTHPSLFSPSSNLLAGTAGDQARSTGLRTFPIRVHEWRFRLALGTGREDYWNYPAICVSAFTARSARFIRCRADSIPRFASRPNWRFAPRGRCGPHGVRCDRYSNHERWIGGNH